MIVTAFVYFFIIIELQEWATDQIRTLISSWGWNPEHWIAWILTMFSQLLILIVSALTFTFTSSIIASPFNDFLAERSEKFTPIALPPSHASGFKNQARLVIIDLFKTFASALAALVAILVSWVPVVNLITFLISFLLVCFQYTSYPQTRRGIGLLEGSRFLWRHLYACAGFGAAISFLFMLPLVSVLALPIAVVGGTLLVARASGNAEIAPLH